LDASSHEHIAVDNVLWITFGGGKVSTVIVSVGNDVVLVERFIAALRRTPMLAERLFTESERITRSGNPRSAESLAARFAAKEAVAKALGAPPGLSHQEAEVVTGEHGKPELRVSGEVAELAVSLGVTRWHLSISHDGGLAIAYVIAES
jgi:holo-[acyl-carrier protein] synthase